MSVACTKIRVRYAETDQMGVAYHANFFMWFEVGRVELLRHTGLDYKNLELSEHRHIAVVEAACRYRSPARYDDELLIETRVTAVRDSVLKFAYRVLREEPTGGPVKLLAEGETSHVVVDRDMKRAMLPKQYATALARCVESRTAR